MKYFLMVIFTCFTTFLLSQLVSPDFTVLDNLDWDKTSMALSKSKKSGWGEGTGITSNYVEQGGSGEISYVVSSASDTKAFGICLKDPLGSDLKILHYGFYLTNGTLYIMSDGKVESKLGSVKDGFKLGIELVGATLLMSLHGKTVLKKTISVTDYFIGAVIYNQGGSFVEILTDFKEPDSGGGDPALEVELSSFLPVLSLESGGQDFNLENKLFSFILLLDQVEEGVKLDYNLYARHRINVTSSSILIGENVKFGKNSFQLDMSGLSAGTYSLEIRLSKGDIIKNKIKIN